MKENKTNTLDEITQIFQQIHSNLNTIKNLIKKFQSEPK
jgi:hypothetical protein